MTDRYRIKQGCCLELMAKLPDACVDMVLCDLPYGTTACGWDTVIPFEPMWGQYRRIIKPVGAIVLFGQEPFSSRLRLSAADLFKYDWYWRKSRPSGFTNAKLKPLKDIEVVSVFSKAKTANGSSGNMYYSPQGLEKVDKKWVRPKQYVSGSEASPSRKSHALERTIEFTNYPRQVLDFSNPNAENFHPTQKPVELCEYLIRTYTSEGMTVLDNCMGSGTTGVACLNTDRLFLGIEKEEKYFEIAKQRLNATAAGLTK